MSGRRCHVAEVCFSISKRPTHVLVRVLLKLRPQEALAQQLLELVIIHGQRSRYVRCFWWCGPPVATAAGVATAVVMQTAPTQQLARPK